MSWNSSIRTGSDPVGLMSKDRWSAIRRPMFSSTGNTSASSAGLCADHSRASRVPSGTRTDK